MISLPNFTSKVTGKIQVFEFLYEKCQEDTSLLYDILDEYVSSLNETELATLEDFLVNNFGED
jgi:hypothetical protein